MSVGRAFLYPLEPLRVLREGEREALRLDLANAQKRRDAASAELEALEVRFAVARRDATAHREDPGNFSLHSQRVAAAYFSSLTAAIEIARRGLGRCEAEVASVIERLQKASVALEAVERHRADARVEHERAAGRLELAQADEAWSQRIHPEERA